MFLGLIITNDSKFKELLSQCEQSLDTEILKDNITFVLKSNGSTIFNTETNQRIGSRANTSKSSLFKKYFDSEVQAQVTLPPQNSY